MRTATADLRDRLQAALGDTYVIERELTRGGMSQLFLATERSLDRRVVVKVLPPELTSEVSAARFHRETQLTAHLQHPHILPILAASARDNLLYYVMPYVDGESLRQKLDREGQLPVAEALRILREVADALAFAHERAVVHRDVKPENILLQGDHAVLADFGIAHALEAARTTDARITETGKSVGTPGYMAPEQVAGEPIIDARADVYALALVGYEMLTGHPPFAGTSQRALLAAHLTEVPPPLGARRGDAPHHICAAIMRALAKAPDDRFATAAEFRDALADPGADPRERPRMRRRWTIAGGAAILAIAVGGAVIARNGARGSALDSNLLTVAPFDVYGPDLQLWREGLVDLLSRNLDGAGSLRTVSPTVVIRRWSGRADATSAAALARSTGARLAVFGTLTRSGLDSVRLAASLLDVGAARALGEIEVRDVVSHMDRLVDSVTLALLRELGRSRAIGTVRRAGVSSRSLPALKAYLQAEQFFRRGGWDSAVAYSERAIALDSTMALAHRRAGAARNWQALTLASGAQYALSAGAWNRGLPPRDSLLIAADSLRASVTTIGVPRDRSFWVADTALLSRLRRYLATLEELVRRYPDDPEGWHELGMARWHFRAAFGVDWRNTLDAFARSIALDSAFVPAYFHAISLGLGLRDTALVRQYAVKYLAAAPLDQSASLAAKILAPNAADGPVLGRMLDGASADVLSSVMILLHTWPDSAETALSLCRRLLRGQIRPGQVPLSFIVSNCVSTLVFRGHLREAYHTSARYDFADANLDLALLGPMPADSASRFFAGWLRPEIRYVMRALPWWGSRGDTAALTAALRLADSVARSSPPTVQSVVHAPYAARAARGYLALARGDTAAAIRTLAALPDSLCCWHERLLAARLLHARGRHGEAAQVLAREHVMPRVFPVLWMLERGRVFKRLGDHERAIDGYSFVTDAWANADPELQPYVTEARRALEHLRATRGRRARPAPQQR